MVTIKQIRKLCKRDKDPTPKILRELSYYITIPFLYLGMTANQVSVLAMILGATAAYLFSLGGYWNQVIASLVLYITYFPLDQVDGNLARIKKSVSCGGDFLDSITPRITLNLVLVGIGYGIYKTTNNPIYIICGVLASLTFLLTDGTMLLRKLILIFYAKQDIKEVENTATKRDKSFKGLIMKIAGFPTMHIRYILIVISLLGLIPWLVIFYGIFLPVRYIGTIVMIFLELKKVKFSF